MTLEFNNQDWAILDAALHNRMERIREMIDLFAERGEWNYVSAYNTELENAKDLLYKVNRIFNTQFD